METETGTKTWRRATAEDAVALRDLERVASLTGLAHVFGELPYPDDDVLARWALLGWKHVPCAIVTSTQLATF